MLLTQILCFDASDLRVSLIVVTVAVYSRISLSLAPTAFSRFGYRFGKSISGNRQHGAHKIVFPTRVAHRNEFRQRQRESKGEEETEVTRLEQPDEIDPL